MKEQGIVHLFFKTSPNVSMIVNSYGLLLLSNLAQNVVRVKHYCKNNPLKNMQDDQIEKEGVLLALSAFGGNERVYAANFYPDW